MVDMAENEKRYGKRLSSQNKKGKYIKSRFPNSAVQDLAIDATIRAAALREKANAVNISRFKQDKTKLPKSNQFNKENSLRIKKEDIREKVRKHGVKAAVTVVIDMSGSMISEEKLSLIKTTLEKIITNVHLNKDKLAVVGFKGKDSETIIPNTKRPTLFLNNLRNISIGGTTPMAAGLNKALEILKKEAKKGEYIPFMLILSDGITNVSLDKSSKDYNNDIKDKLEKNKSIVKDSLNRSNKKMISNPVGDVLAIGEEIAKNKIHTVIVNFEKEENKKFSINRELAFITNGRYYDLERIFESFYVDSTRNNSSKNDNSLVFSSIKRDILDLAFDEILNYERNNI